jgi:drug/metabolite transporter (DMT)-like permease
LCYNFVNLFPTHHRDKPLTTQALPYIILTGSLFGTSLIASRFGVGQFAPLVYIGLRILIASMGYGTIYIFNRRRPWPTDKTLWRHATMLGIFGTVVPMVGIISSLQYLSSGVTSILISAGPALALLMAHIFLPDERLNLKKAAGVMLALTGALFIALRGENGLPNVDQVNPLGYIFVLMAVLGGNGMNVYARKFMRNLDTVDVASIRMWVATLLVMPVAILFVGIDLRMVTGQGYFSLVYAAIAANVLGMFMVFYNVKRFGATAAAMTDYIIPVVASLGGVLLLGEQITSGVIVGMALIVAGLALINQFRRAAPKAI